MKHHPILISVMLGFAVYGCSSSSSSPNGSGSSLTNGNMAGLVALYDSHDSILSSRSGVTVSLIGKTFSTTTDSTGFWNIENIPPGTYTVQYTKPGFGMVEQQGVQFVGGGTDFLGHVTMCQPIASSVAFNPIETVTDTDGFDLFYSANYDFPGDDYGTIVLVAVGTNQNVSGADPKQNLYTQIINQEGELNKIYKQSLYAAGFHSGETAYIVGNALYFYNAGYGMDFGQYYSSYIDDSTGRTIYTSLGPTSNLITLTVP